MTDGFLAGMPEATPSLFKLLRLSSLSQGLGDI